MRDSVVFYRSFAEAIKALPKEEQLKALWAIIDYGLDEIRPEEYGVHTAIFLMAKPQIDANNKRYQNGTKGGRPTTNSKPNDNQNETKPKPNDNQDETKAEPKENVNEKENVKVNDNVKESVSTKFVPPTQQDVAEYCAEKGYLNIDIERFINYYESNGWMVGKNKMKDWRATVRNWNRSQRQELTTKGEKKNSFNNFDQRSYDYDELEKQLLSKGSG